MTPKFIASRIRFKTRTNATTFSDTDLLDALNEAMDDIAGRIVEADEDFFEVPAFTNLEAGRRVYTLPADKLAGITRIEAKLDGVNWVQLYEFDQGAYNGPLDEENILAHFSNGRGEAFFDLSRNTVTIYSGEITNVTDGLKLVYSSYPAPITDLTSEIDLSTDPSATTHGFPRELHKSLLTSVVIEWKGSQQKPIPLNQREQKYEFDLDKALNIVRNANQSREIIGTPNHPTGYWNNGTNL